MTKYLVIDVGCLECQIVTSLIGFFDEPPNDAESADDPGPSGEWYRPHGQVQRIYFTIEEDT